MASPVKSFGERIADALVEDGLLFRKQVEELLEQQKREGTRLLKIIVDKNIVTEQDMAVSIGRVLNTPPINLHRLSISPETSNCSRAIFATPIKWSRSRAWKTSSSSRWPIR